MGYARLDQHPVIAVRGALDDRLEDNPIGIQFVNLQRAFGNVGRVVKVVRVPIHNVTRFLKAHFADEDVAAGVFHDQVALKIPDAFGVTVNVFPDVVSGISAGVESPRKYPTMGLTFPLSVPEA